jgi:hypothetical protein
MPKNLHGVQKEFDNLLGRISDEEVKANFEAYGELMWNDLPSLLEACEDLREELRLQILFK